MTVATTGFAQYCAHAYSVEELAARWRWSLTITEEIVRGFIEAGYMERVGDRVRVTELGERVSRDIGRGLS